MRLALEQRRPETGKYAVDDIREQLAALLPAGFLTATPWTWLAALSAISEGDFAAAEQARPAAPPATARAPTWSPRAGRQYEERQAQHQVRGLDDPELAHFRWMLEELRVSLFAQELGTSLAVSPQRLDKQWQKVQT